ncbi:hypothetical protein GEV27_07670 [Aeromicrobium sp. S22]|uniref:hypothetical protein n=1 Tax=Aeromicrobium sp. S22 TaxID=2662029 RepID=UPI00129E4EFF|nr:hypothetical protein [Aeromicrobium sp. S22]MRK01400.1 hypothetical protein [Aeromicrobium sp. S22]
MNDPTTPSTAACGLFRPGHSVHWIQARLTQQDPRPHTTVEVLGVTGQVITLGTQHGTINVLNHDPARLSTIVDRHGGARVLVGHHVLRLGGGFLISVSDDIEAGLGECTTL